eukprot:TRINITY_DN4436_c0_g1_i2.p1 TRINITY_DN4436_c0_g1~~TRINITY_DN4436_c0_g1_i2.p1  ORF type:complete len:247 (+),score=64.97 TRINITY_DN4436_c0_g1_i2:446-1186(+)
MLPPQRLLRLLPQQPQQLRQPLVWPKPKLLKLTQSALGSGFVEWWTRHGISEKIDQTGDKIVSKYDEKTGRHYHDDKLAAKESAGEKAGAVAEFFGELGAAAKEGYETSRPNDNSTQCVEGCEGEDNFQDAKDPRLAGSNYEDAEEPPPGYDEVFGEPAPAKLPDWCQEHAFRECFSVTICTQDDLMKICTNLVTRFDLLDVTLPMIEEICEQRNVEKEPFLDHTALMLWFCDEAQFGKMKSSAGL